jgi:hypothetical protein
MKEWTKRAEMSSCAQKWEGSLLMDKLRKTLRKMIFEAEIMRKPRKNRIWKMQTEILEEMPEKLQRKRMRLFQN